MITPTRAVGFVAAGFVTGAAGAVACILIVDAVVRHLGRAVEGSRR